MVRKQFLQSILGFTAMTTLYGLQTFANTLAQQETLMPVLFIGHGSPMNAIQNNEFTLGWQKIAGEIPKPTAILCISAHWETKGTFVTAMEKPATIHDFGGFPQALFDVQYPAPGSKWLANETRDSLTHTTVGLNETWGFDHGCWSILKQLYPTADVPVVQMSIDYSKDAQYHFNLAKELVGLRKKGVLVIGSGNMVHNFQYANFNSLISNQHQGHDWAIEANEQLKHFISDNNLKPLIQYQQHSQAFRLAAPTPEHYLPMLYALALRDNNDSLKFFNDAIIGGSFSMTSFIIDKK